MTTVHRMSRAMFRELAAGGGGARAVHALAAARRSRVLVALRAVVDLVERVGHPDAVLVRAAFRDLADLPWPTVREVLAYPRVSAWVLRTAGALASGGAGLDAGGVGPFPPRAGPFPGAAAPSSAGMGPAPGGEGDAWPGHLVAVLAAARALTGSPGVVELPGAATVVLPALGSYRPASAGPVRVTTSAAGTTLSEGGVETPVADRALPRWQPVGRVAVVHRGRVLALRVDGAARHGLPDEVVVHGCFADDRDAAAWRGRLEDGWAVLVDGHGRVAEEVATATSVLTPLSGPTFDQVSATFADMFGCVAMSLPADAVTAALTLAHEVQHAKLAALTDLFTLVRRDSPVRLYAPWRSDPRPPGALLQGAYAHLGVAAFWRGRAGARAEVEFARWRSAAHDAVRALDGSGALTDVGAEFVAGMVEVLDTWSAERVSRHAEEEAARLNEEHRSRWLRAHG